MTAGYVFGPAAVDVELDDAGTAAWLSEFLCPWAEPAPGGCGDVLVRVDASGGAWEAWRRQRAARACLPVPCFALDSQVVYLPGWTEDGGTVAEDADLGCYYRVSAHAVEIAARPAYRRARLGLMRVVREILTSRALAGGRWLDLHAAALAVGGYAVLIAGPKESGKTSLLMHALSSGQADFVANDRVFVGGDPVAATGVPTIVSIRPGTARAFPGLQRDGDRRPVSRCVGERPAAEDAAVADDPLRPLALSPAQLARQLGVGRARGGVVAAVVFPVVDPGVGTWTLETLTQAEGGALLGACRYGARAEPRPKTIFEIAGAPAPASIRAAPVSPGLGPHVPYVRCRLGPDAYRESADGWLRALGLPTRKASGS